MDAELASKYQALQDTIRSYSRVIVAFSGGIDSSLVAFVAGQVLGKNALAVTSGSASLKRTDLELSKKLGDDWGIAHQVIVTDELSKSDYRANPTNRCFYCKTSLYTELAQIASAQNYAFVLNGTNLDDLGDHRPGLIAADDYNVKSPLVEAGFHKADIRALAHELGLENADKPQAACFISAAPWVKSRSTAEGISSISWRIWVIWCAMIVSFLCKAKFGHKIVSVSAINRLSKFSNAPVRQIRGALNF